MTKKEQAIQELEQWLDWETATQGQLDDHVKQVIALVHAIDDADREARGVVDVQEIGACCNCPNMQFDQFLMLHVCDKNGGQALRGMTQPPPSWCPRRKENRK